MSIFGIGVDIVEIDRVNHSLKKFGDSFAKKILHPNEFVKFEDGKFKTKYLAKRFAAKEAFAKAMGTGIVADITFPKIEVVNNNEGKPQLILHDSTLARFEQLGIKNTFLSISDEKNYAIAQVILEK